MSRFLSSAALAAVLVTVTGLGGLGGTTAGCSSTTAGGGGGGGGTDSGDNCPPPMGCPTPDPATTTLDSPTVSFSADVVPLFQKSCSLSSSCHFSPGGGGPTLLYLGGPTSMPPDGAGILKAIINVKSAELPSMNYVTPGDLTNSFLMYKMDGELCQFTTCSNNPVSSCGVVMPQLQCALPGATRDIVRRWIAQGAMNN